MKIPSFLLLLAAAVLSGSAQTPPARPPVAAPAAAGGTPLAPAVDGKAAFPGYKAAFEKYAEQAAEERRSGVEAAEHLFLNELKTLEKNLADDGDLEKILVVQEEVKRFEFSRVPPDEAALKSLPEVAPAAAALKTAVIAAQRNGHTTFVKYATPYTKRLAELETQASRKGEVEFASDVRAERVKVEALLKAAQDFLAANLEAGKPGVPGEKDKPKAARVLPGFTRSLAHLAPKVVAYIPFDADWRRAVPVDVAGQEIACTATNAMFNARGKRGGAVDLGRGSELVLKKHAALKAMETYSISFWFRTKDPQNNLITARHRVDEEEHEEAPDEEIALNIRMRDGGRVAFSVGDHRVNSNRDQLGNNAWHHVVAIRAKDELVLYLDGEPAGSAKAKSTGPANLPDLVVGWPTHHDFYNSRTGSTEYYTVRFNGSMDELVILDAILNPQEVKTIYQSQK